MELVTEVASKKFQTLFEKATQFDLEICVIRYMNKQKVTRTYADAVAAETLKYLCLCNAFREHDWIITGEIDEFWHTMILFTERYEKFCDAVFGHFLHHVPAEEGRLRDKLAGKSLSRELKADGYRKTVELYQAITGNAPPKLIWPSDLVISGPQVPQPCGCGGGGPCEPMCGCSRPKTCFPEPP